MRPERNPLDLNNLPEEYGREGKQVFEDSSIIDSEASDTTKCRKKRNGGKDGKDECGKIYECRFCSLKFCKSQALGGHMNRHRQERETETLNRARQLVFSNENLSAQGGPHLGLRDPNLLGGAQPISSGNFHQSGNMGDPSLPFRSVYPTRLFSCASPPPQPPPQPSQPYHYGSSSSLVSYPPHYLPHPMNDYLVGHVCTGNSHQNSNLKFGGPVESNYTCIGAPMGQNFVPNDRAVRGTDLPGEGSLNNQQDWGNGYAGTQQQRSDSFPINRFKDGF